MRRLAAALLVLLLAGCGSGSEGERMEADTARFTWGARTATVPLEDCGREGDVVVLGGAANGLVVQAEADVGEGGLDRTGVTGDMGPDDGIWGAFGAEMEHGPAGEITQVDVDGDRLIVEGRWVVLDGDLVPQPGTEVEGRLVARCPEADEPS